MDSVFKNFSFGGDFKLQLDDSSFPEFSSPVLDETGAANISGKAEQNLRKRKIDKDGFVTPTTPDIPKTSSHYGETCHDEESLNSNLGDSLPGEAESHSGLDSSEHSSHPTDVHSDPQPTEVFLAESSTHGESSKHSTTASSVKDLLNEFGQEAKFLQTQWADTFKESEDFELLCSNRLDDYIEEAKQLESTLDNQKDVLFHRLQGIGKTLQQV